MPPAAIMVAAKEAPTVKAVPVIVIGGVNTRLVVPVLVIVNVVLSGTATVVVPTL